MSPCKKLHCLLFCPITLVSDNHFRFFFSRLDYFLRDNLKLRLKVSAVIAGWGHSSLFVENKSIGFSLIMGSTIDLNKAGKVNEEQNEEL